MPYIVQLFAHRKPGITPAAFKAHYESSHVPLIQSLAGHLFPLTHTRTYIQRTKASEGTDNSAYPASVLLGTQASCDYDAITEMTFDNENEFETFYAHMSQAENIAKIRADEDHFLDRDKMTIVIVDEVTQSKRS